MLKMQSGVTSTQISNCYVDLGASRSHNATKMVLQIDGDTKGRINLSLSLNNSQPNSLPQKLTKVRNSNL